MTAAEGVSPVKDHGLPREFALAAACCRWPLGEAALGAIRERGEAAIDWAVFVDVVRRQRVAGLVHNALAAARIDCPSAAAEKVAALARHFAAQNLQASAESVRLQREFDGAGIPTIVLKGVALAQLAYGSLAFKHTRDIDLFVPPEFALSAFPLLERAGYALFSPAERLSAAQRRGLVEYGKEVEYLHRGKSLRVEIQWRLAYNALLLKGIDAVSATQTVALPDGDVRTLADDDLFAYLCVHGACHDWSRLKWLADLNAWISAKGDGEIARLYRHAQARGAGFCAGQALLLCHRLLDLSLPADLLGELHASRRLQRLLTIALQAMVGVDGRSEPDRGTIGVMRAVWTPFLLGQGPAYYAAQLRTACVGPADVIRWPLPRPLHFLYPILRVPLWLWRRVKWASAALSARLPSAAQHPVTRAKRRPDR